MTLSTQKSNTKFVILTHQSSKSKEVRSHIVREALRRKRILRNNVRSISRSDNQSPPNRELHTTSAAELQDGRMKHLHNLVETIDLSRALELDPDPFDTTPLRLDRDIKRYVHESLFQTRRVFPSMMFIVKYSKAPQEDQIELEWECPQLFHCRVWNIVQTWAEKLYKTNPPMALEVDRKAALLKRDLFNDISMALTTVADDPTGQFVETIMNVILSILVYYWPTGDTQNVAVHMGGFLALFHARKDPWIVRDVRVRKRIMLYEAASNDPGWSYISPGKAYSSRVLEFRYLLKSIRDQDVSQTRRKAPLLPKQSFLFKFISRPVPQEWTWIGYYSQAFAQISVLLLFCIRYLRYERNPEALTAYTKNVHRLAEEKLDAEDSQWHLFWIFFVVFEETGLYDQRDSWKALRILNVVKAVMPEQRQHVRDTLLCFLSGSTDDFVSNLDVNMLINACIGTSRPCSRCGSGIEAEEAHFHPASCKLTQRPCVSHQNCPQHGPRISLGAKARLPIAHCAKS